MFLLTFNFRLVIDYSQEEIKQKGSFYISETFFKNMMLRELEYPINI